MSRASGGWPKAPSGICEHLQLKNRFKKSLSMSGEIGSLAGDRVVSRERSRPADLHTALGRDTRGLIVRTIVVAFLAALFWHTVIAAGRPWHPEMKVRLTHFSARNQLLHETSLFSEATMRQIGFRKQSRPRFFLSKKPAILSRVSIIYLSPKPAASIASRVLL